MMNAMWNVCKRVRQHETHPGPSPSSGPPLQGGDCHRPHPLLGGVARQRRGGLFPARFFSDRRAVGSAVVAAIFTLMSLAGVALVGDHKHMTTNRDLLKGAANAATIAVMMELDGRSLGALTTGERSALDATARRYILANIKANIPADKHQQAADTLSITIKSVGPGLVDVDAAADLGNIVFGRWLWSDVAKKTEVVSRTERVSTTTEVVLALDVTVSMCDAPDGTRAICNSTQSRLGIVKRAAQSLIDLLTADDNDQTAFGLVPWTYGVRLDRATKTRWQDNSWAVYPQTRTYPRPYDNAPTGETHALPVSNEEWLGCVDQRPLCSGQRNPWVGCLDEYNGSLPPGLSLSLPQAEPFTMDFFSARITGKWSPTKSISYTCRAGGTQDLCYDDSAVPEELRSNGDYWRIAAQGERDEGGCLGTSTPQSTIMPLTTDIDTVKQRIRNVREAGSETYSTLGLVWGRRLLAPSWNQVWGGGDHPMPAGADVQKALVLLTDGEDNHVSGEQGKHRARACTAAKNEGLTVFTIAAMNTSDGYTAFRDALVNCASKPEYAFINNSTPEALEQAFQDIAAQLLRFRRVM